MKKKLIIIGLIIFILFTLTLLALTKKPGATKIEPVAKDKRSNKRVESRKNRIRREADIFRNLPKYKNPPAVPGEFSFEGRDIFKPEQTSDLTGYGYNFDGSKDENSADAEPGNEDRSDLSNPAPTDIVSSGAKAGPDYELLGQFLATAYSGPEFNSDGITKAGTKVRLGVVAVDPEVIKLGTVVLVEGYGEAVAEDTGNMIKGKHIDIWLPSVKEANNYGKKTVKVWINKKREAKPPFNN